MHIWICCRLRPYSFLLMGTLVTRLYLFSFGLLHLLLLFPLDVRSRHFFFRRRILALILAWLGGAECNDLICTTSLCSPFSFLFLGFLTISLFPGSFLSNPHFIPPSYRYIVYPGLVSISLQWNHSYSFAKIAENISISSIELSKTDVHDEYVDYVSCQYTSFKVNPKLKLDYT